MEPKKTVGVYDKPEKPLLPRVALWLVVFVALVIGGFFAVSVFS